MKNPRHRVIFVGEDVAMPWGATLLTKGLFEKGICPASTVTLSLSVAYLHEEKVLSGD